MSNRDASFVGVFPTLGGFIICIQTRITDCWKIMNRIARKSVFGFPIGSDTNGLPPMMARCINLWNKKEEELLLLNLFSETNALITAQLICAFD